MPHAVRSTANRRCSTSTAPPASTGNRCAPASPVTACATPTAWPSRPPPPSIDPDYQNLYVKSNLSGEFTVINPWLVRELKALGLWDEVMAADLKYFDGALGPIDRIPAELKSLYVTAFEIDPTWLVEAAARRQKWIDQAQSLNLYFAAPTGRQLDDLYRLAWRRGLKTTYYLRTLGATRVEKTTADPASLSLSAPIPSGQACSLLEPDCEACQ